MKRKSENNQERNQGNEKASRGLTNSQDAKLLMEALADYRMVKDAVPLLGMHSEKSVNNLIRFKKIQAVKIGRDYWIHLDEIDRYNRTRNSPGRPPQITTPKL